MTDQKYNGWTNYQTWLVNLWMGNDQSTQEMVMERVREILEDNQECDDETGDVTGHDRDNATDQVARWLAEWHDEFKPETTGVFADLLGHALGMVDWQEIAYSLVSDALEAA